MTLITELAVSIVFVLICVTIAGIIVAIIMRTNP
jgi:hypothetical protein